MKIISFVMVCALAACGGKKADPASPVTNTDPAPATEPAAGDGVPCSQEIALECPEGQIDGCLKTPPEGETHACVAQ